MERQAEFRVPLGGVSPYDDKRCAQKVPGVDKFITTWLQPQRCPARNELSTKEPFTT